MALTSKVTLLTEIIRTVESGNDSDQKIFEHLSKRPNTLGSEVSSLILLAKQFNFIKENDGQILSPTSEGITFMNYVESQMTLDLKTENIDVDEVSYPPSIVAEFNKIKEKYDDKKIKDDLDQLCISVSTISENKLQVDTTDLLLTVSLPPGLSNSGKIPPELRGSTIHHDEAIKKVVLDVTSTLRITSPYIDKTTLKMLIGNLHTNRTSCKIITSDVDRLAPDSYNLKQLKDFLKTHFLTYEIRLVKKNNTISHAKAWISEKSIHITSANILENSQTDNFELGIYSTNNILVRHASILFEKVWDSGTEL